MTAQGVLPATRAVVGPSRPQCQVLPFSCSPLLPLCLPPPQNVWLSTKLICSICFNSLVWHCLPYGPCSLPTMVSRSQTHLPDHGWMELLSSHPEQTARAWPPAFHTLCGGWGTQTHKDHAAISHMDIAGEVTPPKTHPSQQECSVTGLTGNKLAQCLHFSDT